MRTEMTAKSYLGKIFISHSSVDKPFVRELDRRLRDSGYDTWLDEHEMVVGDPLAKKISEGLREARVVLVVVSDDAIKSRWLSFELNIATDRMVKGECHVIPVVLSNATMPAEVVGILYADFRGDFDDAFKSIERALQKENERAEADAAFWIVVDRLVRSVFGGHGHLSIDSGYLSRHYELVYVPVPAGPKEDSTTVVYDVIPAYIESAEPLTIDWWRDFRAAMEESDEKLFFAVTERRVAFEVTRPYSDETAVSYCEFVDEPGKPYACAVFADLTSVSRDRWRDVIVVARDLLISFAKQLSTSA